MEPPVPISEREVPDATALPPAQTGEPLGAHDAMEEALPSGPAMEASLAPAATPRATAPPHRRLCKAQVQRKSSPSPCSRRDEHFDCTCCSGVGYDDPVDLTGDGGLHGCFLGLANLRKSLVFFGQASRPNARESKS